MFFQCKRSKFTRFLFCQMVKYSATNMTFILSTIFIMYILSVFGAPLDNVQNVNIEIESGNETLIVGEKVQHEDRHANDTSSNERNNDKDDDNGENYYDDDYDIEGGGIFQYLCALTL